MAKGEQKSGREKKKPKQDKAKNPAPKSDYAKRQAETGAAQPFMGKKK